MLGRILKVAKITEPLQMPEIEEIDTGESGSEHEHLDDESYTGGPERWRDESGAAIWNKLPRPDEKCQIKQLPDMFRDFIIYPANPTFLRPRPKKENFFSRPLIIWAPDIFWNKYALLL